jgi:N-formylglutamate amidohydrolase
MAAWEPSVDQMPGLAVRGAESESLNLDATQPLSTTSPVPPASPAAALVFPALPSAEALVDDLFTPFELAGPDRPVTPLIFASPHSGRIYPAPMMIASRLGADSIRRSEDVWVDQLIAGAAPLGARLINARLARVYLDVNREPWELDPAMFSDELPAYARGRSPRVAAGLGAIARIVAEGEEVYARKLTFAEARHRVEAVHAPYHAALKALTAEALSAHGIAVLLDWHSMPSAATRHAAGGACDVVLGDRFGGASSPAIARAVERGLASLGYRVVRNTPYAGGYTTEHYGRPAKGVHALQIEVNRALYVDEASLTPTPWFARLKADLERLFEGLAETDWAGIA